MNSFVLGLLSSVVLFVVIGASFYIGYRLGIKNKPIPQVKSQDELSIDEKHELQRLENLQKGFVKLMNYDVNTALQRKKV